MCGGTSSLKARIAAPLIASLVLAGVVLTGLVRGAAAQETPRYGGELVFVVPAEPPSFDAHRVGVQGVGTPFAAAPAELEKLAGYGRDIGAARAEARRLLKDAGVPDGFSFTFRNRAIRDPYEPLGVWLVDQWRQIGLNVKVETLELATLYNEIRGGSFDVAADFHCSYIVEPDLALFKFQSADVSHVNYSRYTDRALDELYQRQSRATDREERRRSIREFEKRLLDEEVHYIFTFQWHRIVPHNARLKGWTITPSHFLNNQLDTVWLAPE
jgi:peptide/nickel transport system substrate-binding protein